MYNYVLFIVYIYIVLVRRIRGDVRLWSVTGDIVMVKDLYKRPASSKAVVMDRFELWANDLPDRPFHCWRVYILHFNVLVAIVHVGHFHHCIHCIL